MFKLCKTCGYINKGDAIECEECHSLLDIDISKKNKNTSDKAKKNRELKSISSIFNIKTNKIVDPNKVHSDEEFAMDKKYINDHEIAIEDNNIEIIKEAPKPAPAKQKVEKKIDEKPIEKIKQPEPPIVTEKEIIEKTINIDNNEATEIEPDESTVSDLYFDADTYNEIPVEDNVEESLPKEEKESDEIPSDSNDTNIIEDFTSSEKQPDVFKDTKVSKEDTSGIKEIEENKTIPPIVKAEPTVQDILITEKANELSRIVDSIQSGSNLSESSVIQTVIEETEKPQQIEESKQEKQEEKINKNEEPIIEEDPFISQIKAEEKIEKEKEDLEVAKEKQEEDRIKKVVSEALKEVVLQVTEEDEEGIRIRRKRKILDEEPEEIAPLENLETEEKEHTIARKPRATLTSVKPMEIKKRSNENAISAESNDDSLQDAMDVFETMGIKPVASTNESSNQKTVVYDLVGAVPKHDAKSDNIATKDESKEKDDDNDKPTKSLLGKKKVSKEKRKKKIEKNKIELSVVQKSIAISAVIALIIVLIIIISRVNRSKELKVYTNNLVGDQNVSYQQVYDLLAEKGYSEKEILGVLADLHIDFNEFALNVLYSAALDTNKLATKKDAESLLIRNGFTTSEVDYAMTNADWNKFLSIYIEACISKIKVLDKKTIMKTIQDSGFSEQEKQYVDNNIDWAKLAKKNINSFTSNEELHTKDEINIYLLDLGYSEKDIIKTFEEYDWDAYAYTYLTKYLENKEAEGDPIELSRPLYTEILTEAGFSSEEVSNVMARYDFAAHASSKVDSLITTGKDFINKSELKKSLANEGYTAEEIEQALAETNWNEAAITSLKSLDNTKLSKNEMLKTLKDAEYSDKELEYATTKYEWDTQGLKYIEYLKNQKKNGNEAYLRTTLKEAGYTSDEIDKMIISLNFEQSVDWFEEAAKNDILTIKDSDNFSRSKAKKYLAELHYGDKEINAALATISYADWKRYASSFLSSTDFDSRVEARQKLQNEGFANSSENKEIDYAIQSVNWSNKCKEYTKKLYNQSDKCKEYNKFISNSETSIEQSLKLAEYTSDEIRTALIEIFATAPSGCDIQ